MSESDSGRMPDFLLLGAMKSGTTTLHDHLSQHPSLFLCEPKEPQFFSRDHVFERGLPWYRSLFADAQPEQVCGEASTCYSRWPHFGDVAGRIQEHLPEARFLYLMRHPAERAFSHYRHLMEERLLKGGEILSFEQALQVIPEILDTSRYMLQIEQYLARFPRDRFHFLILEDLRERRAETLGGVCRFLGVGPPPVKATHERMANRSGKRLVRETSDEALGHLRRWPGVRQVIDLMPTGFRRQARRWMTRSPLAGLLAARRSRRMARSVTARLELEQRQVVLRAVDSSTRQLEQLLARSLPGWFQ